MLLRNVFCRQAWVLALGLIVAMPALADDRTAEQILKDIDAVEMPKLDPSQRSDAQAVQEYIAKRQEAMQKRNELILELYKTAPDNERVPELLIERWQGMQPVGPAGEKLVKEIDDVLAHVKDDKLKLEGTWIKAVASFLTARSEPDSKIDMEPIDAFLAMAPKDVRGAQILYAMSNIAKDDQERNAIENRILKEYPEGPQADAIKAIRKRREAIGKPFELEFADAISGSTISMKDLKGKVVVVDFWATWCGPCVAEMPHMKELYAEYKDKGVEFIGVSLDQPKEDGGLDELKKFVEKNEIDWPQYYQGNGWESEFSKGWGIDSIPSMFVVDQDGNLYSIEARGKLETIVPELLKKHAAGASGE